MVGAAVAWLLVVAIALGLVYAAILLVSLIWDVV